MPTYEYECQKCGHHFELFQNMSDEPVKRCPECKGKVKRLIGTGAGLLFKGGGFYATDYRSESYKQGEHREKSASSKKTETKKDSGKAEKTTTATKEK
ncbi:MAG: zinc ribbon domain-containing protein [Spartobacteria bacterium]|nr:zinc ribbon domain-containing protein [Spartobacteria bacterium]